AVAPLSTKLVAPPRRGMAIDRVHLLDRLDASVRLPLTLVCAPAGFGKTTLLADWLGRTALPVAWVALDPADNDPARFWMYCLVALQHVDARLGGSALALLRAPHGAPLDIMLSDLLHELASLERPIVLVLDDYHVIEASDIHRGLIYLLDHQPPQLRIV